MTDRDLINLGFSKEWVGDMYKFTRFGIEIWFNPNFKELEFYRPRPGKLTQSKLTFEQVREMVRKESPKQSPATEDSLLDMGFSKRKVLDLYYYEKDNLTLIYNPANPDYGFYWIGGGGRHRQNLSIEQVGLLYNYIHKDEKLKVK